MSSFLNASHAHNPCAFPQTTHLLVDFELALKDDCSASLGVEDIEQVVRVLSAARDCFYQNPGGIVQAAHRD